MWTLKSLMRSRFDKRVDGLDVQGLDAVSEQELLQIEGGRARVVSMFDEATRRLPTSEVRVELPNY
jgi:hypothetical protein